MEKKRLFIADRLRLATTNECNVTCFYCHNEGQEHNEPKINRMSLDFINILLDFVDKNDVYIDKISLTGGEAILHPKIYEIARIMKSSSNVMSLITNGIALNREKIDRLIESGVNKFKFGIDSLKGECTKLCIKRHSVDKEKVIDNILYTQKALGNTQLNITVCNENYDELKSIITFAKANRIKTLSFNELVNVGFRSYSHTIRVPPTLDGIPAMLGDYCHVKDSQDREFGESGDYTQIKLNPDFCNKTQACDRTYTILHENNVVHCSNCTVGTRLLKN